MEALEDLKAIIAGKQDGDMFYCDGQYLDHRLNVRSEHTKYAINGKTYYFNYQQPVSVMMNKLRSLSDIEQIIEKREMLELAWQAICEAGYEEHCNELRDYMESL